MELFTYGVLPCHYNYLLVLICRQKEKKKKKNYSFLYQNKNQLYVFLQGEKQNRKQWKSAQ